MLTHQQSGNISYLLGPRYLRHDKAALLNIIQGDILTMIGQEILSIIEQEIDDSDEIEIKPP